MATLLMLMALGQWLHAGGAALPPILDPFPQIVAYGPQRFEAYDSQGNPILTKRASETLIRKELQYAFGYESARFADQSPLESSYSGSTERLDLQHSGRLHVTNASAVVQRLPDGSTYKIGSDYAGNLQVRDPLSGRKRHVTRSTATDQFLGKMAMEKYALMDYDPFQGKDRLLVRLIDVPEGQTVYYRVLGRNGRIVSVATAPSQDIALLDLQDMPAGEYYLEAHSEGLLYTRLVRVHHLTASTSSSSHAFTR